MTPFSARPLGLAHDRAGHPLLGPQLDAARLELLRVLGDRRLRGNVVARPAHADLDQAAQLVLAHLDEARKLLEPFFYQWFAVGERVSVRAFSSIDGDVGPDCDPSRLTVVAVRRGEVTVEDTAGHYHVVSDRAVNPQRPH